MSEREAVARAMEQWVDQVVSKMTWEQYRENILKIVAELRGSAGEKPELTKTISSCDVCGRSDEKPDYPTSLSHKRRPCRSAACANCGHGWTNDEPAPEPAPEPIEPGSVWKTPYEDMRCVEITGVDSNRIDYKCLLAGTPAFDEPITVRHEFTRLPYHRDHEASDA